MISANHFTALMLLIIAPLTTYTHAQEVDSLVANGEYVLKVSGCIHCHSTDEGVALAGGRALDTPFGIFYTPNITSHKSTGIGAWSRDDFRQALKHGVSPDGSDYYPAFPFTSYSQLRADDIDAMFAYILSRPASDKNNRKHELEWFLRWRIAAQVWKWLFFEPVEFQKDIEHGNEMNRGAYIAEAMGHCGECHTPRNLLGALDTDRAYAGNPNGPDQELVPNITSDKTTGIGDWSREELIEFLKYGELPDGEYVVGSMDPVIQGMSFLTSNDRDSLAEYLLSLTPIENHVRK